MHVKNVKLDSQKRAIRSDIQRLTHERSHKQGVPRTRRRRNFHGHGAYAGKAVFWLEGLTAWCAYSSSNMWPQWGKKNCWAYSG